MHDCIMLQYLSIDNLKILESHFKSDLDVVILILLWKHKVRGRVPTMS